MPIPCTNYRPQSFLQVLVVTFVFSARSELELSRFIFENETASVRHHAGLNPPPSRCLQTETS